MKNLSIRMWRNFAVCLINVPHQACLKLLSGRTSLKDLVVYCFKVSKAQQRAQQHTLFEAKYGGTNWGVIRPDDAESTTRRVSICGASRVCSARASVPGHHATHAKENHWTRLEICSELPPRFHGWTAIDRLISLNTIFTPPIISIVWTGTCSIWINLRCKH